MAGSKQFTRVSDNHPNRNLFDLTHSLKSDHDFGYIYPVLVKSCIPGDVVRLGIKNVTRMIPAVVPFAHQVDINYYSFFVPYRILDFKQTPGLFESVISGGLDGADSRDFPRFGAEVTVGSYGNTFGDLGYYQNLYTLDYLLSNSAVKYYPSSSSSATSSIHFYPTSTSDTDSYLEPSYVFPNPQGVTTVTSSTYSSVYHKLAFGLNSLCDYMGVIPPSAFGIESKSDSYTESTSSVLSKVLAYPWYAYNRIYIDYFADENLESAIFRDPSGVQDNGDFFVHGNSILMRANWEKDYFSSSLPWQQRGNTIGVDTGTTSSFLQLGLGSSVLSGFSSNPSVADVSTGFYWVTSEDNDTTSKTPTVGFTESSTVSSSAYGFRYAGSLQHVNSSSGYFYPVYQDGSVVDSDAFSVGVDPSSITGSFDVAQLRNAISVQHFLERNARSGVRYTEFLRSHFGVSPSDSRLQRAEYLGGTKTNLVVSEVLQTSETTSTGSSSGTLGDYAGKGIIAMEDGRVINSYHVEEFGCIMVVMTVRPKPAYYQGIPREWLYGDRFSWFFPEFQNLSEQAIMNQELYITPSMSSESCEGIFGYQGIYDELRTAQDRVAGELRDTLDYWHLARKFTDTPSLSYDFIKVMPYSDDLHRVFSYEGTESDPYCPFIMTHVFQLSMLRPMTFMPNPGISYI